MNQLPARLNRLIPVLLLLSGFCGISYEILYTKLLGNLLGNPFTINATVLLTFLLGIGLGTLYAHRFRRYLWLIEGGIGLYAATLTLLYPAVESLLYRGIPFRELEGRGAIFSTTADSEVIVQLLARSREHTLEERLIDALSRVKGAFSLVVQTSRHLDRRPRPVRLPPALSLGRLDGAWVAASETCALDLIGATHERDLDPGEVVVIRRGRLRTLRPFSPNRDQRETFCIFEYIYFARPDSNLNGHSVYAFRKELGRALAREHPVEADLVVPGARLRQHRGARLRGGVRDPLRAGDDPQPLLREADVHRAERSRSATSGSRSSTTPVRGILDGKRVVLVDDSIVRGTTLIKLVTMLRNAGAREVHLRISSPPTIGPCHYGIDTPTREELIAQSEHSVG